MAPRSIMDRVTRVRARQRPRPALQPRPRTRTSASTSCRRGPASGSVTSASPTTATRCPYDDIVTRLRGVEGQVRHVDRRRARSREPERSKTIAIEDFVDLARDRPDLLPEDLLRLPRLRTGLRQTVRAVAAHARRVGPHRYRRFVMRDHEYLVAVRPYGNVLALETMYFPDEVREPKQVADPPKNVASTRGVVDGAAAHRLARRSGTRRATTTHTANGCSTSSSASRRARRSSSRSRGPRRRGHRPHGGIARQPRRQAQRGSARAARARRRRRRSSRRSRHRSGPRSRRRSRPRSARPSRRAPASKQKAATKRRRAS